MNREAELDQILDEFESFAKESVMGYKHTNNMSADQAKAKLNSLIDRLVIEGRQGASEKPQPVEHASGKQVDTFAVYAAAERHLNKLRHSVKVGHWDSTCGNCHASIVVTTGKINCPRCNFAIDSWTTDYVGEDLSMSQALFPELPYFNQYDVSDLVTPSPDANTSSSNPPESLLSQSSQPPRADSQDTEAAKQ